ncbi:biotin/lipoyl-containing protein [Congregibacter brevis]|uniref:Biotin/lipoyl-containing protein n=1 Tax=Congregibacter brevis TaxID=3081201 RepID=A0ABZ0I9W2_9GAMM|nr:biotin/lipoyl-containing protein [Congregibacter sp. IMCC45268]
MSNEHYLRNPLIHSDRQLGRQSSAWVSQFDCSHMRPLIICRGPIRKEAIDVFREMGIRHIGILLSEKDSIVYQNALAPELRVMPDPERIHRVPDYTGANKEERDQRIQQIIGIARDNGYNSIFAGYGFMAEDETMVAAMEAAGLNFIGPCSRTVHDAGLKDEAKRTALKTGVSVTPGIDNATALTLLKRHPDHAALAALIAAESLPLDPETLDAELEAAADQVLAASYSKGVDLYTVDELSETITEAVLRMSEQYPSNRVRLKAISGGGGKGQRILGIGEADRAGEMVREILNEVKTTGVGDNKNVLVELNIETTRHQEIQVIGNGIWSMSLGGRDCSLQMHEQKLLEVSVTLESLHLALEEAKAQGNETETAVLEQDIHTLSQMEDEAARFGEAVGLDSVSTFECIVDRDKHFFMEMNTRIQVEHRVTELCYALRFANPNDSEDHFVVESLVEAMVLLAAHGAKLPKPHRVQRYNDSVEARLNATNQALQPSAGGIIEYWSDAIDGEIRDDQGISLHNPDTDVFMKYTLAGAYDSNIALLLTVGGTRLDCYQRMAETIRQTQMRGKDLATNLEFHYGLVNWFLGQNINARPTTRFIVPYLTAVGELKREALDIDLEHAWKQLSQREIDAADDAGAKSLAATLDLKHTLLLRPLELLLEEPHLLSGWLSIHSDSYTMINGHVSWNDNPIELLVDLYHFLNMDYLPGAPAAGMIWEHDHDILQDAQAFYSKLNTLLPAEDWLATQTQLSDDAVPEGVELSKQEWATVQAAHRGYQSGCSIMSVLPAIAEATGFFALTVNDDLTIDIPERLNDPDLQSSMAKVLVPPPVAKSDEIIAASGGMFYGRETPESPLYVEKGDHFDAGDPLYIVEVMKMFNKVYAPFSGTIEEVLVDSDGMIISKGQPVFRITPDEKIVVESPQEVAERRRSATARYLDQL